MEKIFNNEGYMKDRLKRAKTDRVFYDLPDIDIDENGAFYDKGIVRIQTLADLENYCARHQIIANNLIENYPKVVAAIYRNAMTELSDPKAETNISRILSGKKVKSNLVYQAAYAPSARSAVRGFLNTINSMNSGLKGKTVELPLVKKTKKQVMKMFEKNKKGYFVPEINAEGLVVSKDGGKFSTNFVAVPASEITNEQLLEYFKAPYGDKADEMGIDFEDIIALSRQAYGEIGSSSVAGVVSVLVDSCAENYPLSFNVKSDKKPEYIPAEASDPEIEIDPELDNEEKPEKEESEKEPEDTIDEIEISGGGAIDPGLDDDGNLIITIVPDKKDEYVYTYEIVDKAASHVKNINGLPTRKSAVKKLKITKVKIEESEQEKE